MHIFTWQNFSLGICCIVPVLWTFDCGTDVFRLYQLHEVATPATLTNFMQLHSQGSTNFPNNLEGPFQILGTQRMSWSKFHTQDQQSWRDLWMSLLAGTFCLLHANWHTFLYVRKRTAVITLKIFGTKIKNSVTWVSWHSGFMHPSTYIMYLAHAHSTEVLPSWVILFLATPYCKSLTWIKEQFIHTQPNSDYSKSH